MNIQEYIQSGAIESYVLGVADEEDAAELQRLKAVHPEVGVALEAAEAWLLNYTRAHAVPAAEDTREQLLRMLKAEALDRAAPARVYPLRPRNLYKYLATASLILVVISAALAFYFYRGYEHAAADYAFVSDPSILKVSLPGVAGKENYSATLYWDTHNKNVYLDASHLQKAPTGKQYQLWALVDGKPVDAGLVEKYAGLSRLKTVQKAQAFAITLENAGGSSTPTLSQMYVLGNVKS